MLLLISPLLRSRSLRALVRSKISQQFPAVFFFRLLLSMALNNSLENYSIGIIIFYDFSLPFFYGLSEADTRK